MAGWNYLYKAGPKGGTLLDLLTWADNVRVVDEVTAGKDGENVMAQYIHGSNAVTPKYSTEGLIGIEVAVRYTDSAGAITHANGEAGHVHENLGKLKKILRGGRLLTTLQRQDPHWGNAEIDGECRQPIQSSQVWFHFLFPFNTPDPFWRVGSLVSVNPVPTLAVGGNAPVSDAEIVFPAGASTPLLTHTDTGAAVQLEGVVPAGGVRYFNRTGLAQRITGGTDYSEFVTLNKPYGIVLEEDATNNFTYSGGGSALIEYFAKVL